MMLSGKLLLLFVLVCQFVRNEAYVRINLKITNYQNYKDRKSNGWRCETLWGDYCDPFFQICFGSSVYSCNLISSKTRVYRNTKSISNVYDGYVNAHSFPTRLFLRIQAYDREIWRNHEKIFDVEKTFFPKGLDLRNVFYGGQSSTTVTATISFKCSADYYGPRCNKLCRPSFGNYYCHPRTGLKVCLVKCRNGGSCYWKWNSFSCNCVNGWTGRLCTTPPPPPPPTTTPELPAPTTTTTTTTTPVVKTQTTSRSTTTTILASTKPSPPITTATDKIPTRTSTVARETTSLSTTFLTSSPLLITQETTTTENDSTSVTDHTTNQNNITLPRTDTLVPFPSFKSKRQSTSKLELSIGEAVGSMNLVGNIVEEITTVDPSALKSRSGMPITESSHLPIIILVGMAIVGLNVISILGVVILLRQRKRQENRLRDLELKHSSLLFFNASSLVPSQTQFQQHNDVYSEVGQFNGNNSEYESIED